MTEEHDNAELRRADAEAVHRTLMAGHPAPLALDTVFTHTPTISKLAEALAVAQSKFPELKASQTADAEKYTYNYADLASVLAAVRPSLSAQGIAIVQGVSTQRAQGTGSAVVAVETRLLHSSGEWIATTLKLPTTETAPQKIGSLISYLRRYGLLSITAVAAEDDDGATAGNGEPAPQRPAAARQQRAAAPQTTTPKTTTQPAQAAPKPAAAAAPKADPKAAATERHRPISGVEGTINAADRGLLFKIAKEQNLNERNVKGLIFSLFGYTSTSQIRSGPEFNKVINAMEDPPSHGVVFEADDAVYTRENDQTPLPVDVTTGLP